MSPAINNWKTVKIGDLGQIITGGTPSSRYPGLFGTDYPFITPTDIDNSCRHIETERFLSEQGRDDQSSRLLPPGAVCVVCIGATIGKICMTNKHSFTNQQINSIIVNKTNYDNSFVFHLLRTKNEVIKSIAGGAAIPIVNKTAFSNIKVVVPCLPTQRKIAAILSAYDDLIENNLRRIEILEELAQNLYAEWFIKFRFPGHEKVKMIDSPLGRIPEGWVVGKLSETFASFTDGDWIETKDQGGQGYRLLQVSNIGIGKYVETGNFRYITQDTFTRLQCQEVIPGDILIARMPKPTGRAWLVTPQPWRMITAVDVAIAKPNSSSVNPYFLLNMLNSLQQLASVEQQTTGTTRPRITRISLASLPTVTPSLAIQNEFGTFSKGLYSFSSYLQNANTTLGQTRNLLLSRLISGELDVSALDIKTGDDE